MLTIHTATAKGSLLRLDKQFRDSVVSVLKTGMATKSALDYEALKKELKTIHDEAMVICWKLQTKYSTLTIERTLESDDGF